MINNTQFEGLRPMLDAEFALRLSTIAHEAPINVSVARKHAEIPVREFLNHLIEHPSLAPI